MQTTNIPVLILSGGQGTRIRHLLGDLPKPMYPVLDKPFLDFQIEYLRSFGFSDFYISSGYKSEAIETHYKSDPNVKVIKESEPLGTGGAILYAMQAFKEDSFICMNGDSLCLIDFEAFLQTAEKYPGQITIALNEVDDTSRYGRVTIDVSQNVTAFLEKDPNQKYKGLINSGIYFLRKSLFSQSKFPQVCSVEKDIFPEILEQGKIKGWASNAAFIDIGTPETLKEIESFVKIHKLV